MIMMMTILYAAAAVGCGVQEAGGSRQRLAGQEPRRASENVSDDDVDVARLGTPRQRRVHDLVQELPGERHHLLPARSQV